MVTAAVSLWKRELSVCWSVRLTEGLPSSPVVLLSSHRYLASLPIELLKPKLPFSPAPRPIYHQALLALPLLVCLSREGVLKEQRGLARVPSPGS